MEKNNGNKNKLEQDSDKIELIRREIKSGELSALHFTDEELLRILDDIRNQ